MDRALPAVSDDGDLAWSECHSNSDDGHSMILPDSPTWIEPLTSATSMASSSALDISHTGQLSPISTGVDVGAMADSGACVSGASAASSTPTMIHSATSSSSTDSWSNEGGESDDFVGSGCGDNDNDNDMSWEQGPDDILTVAKLEPQDDDDFRMDDFKEAPLESPLGLDDSALIQPKPKRPRGRPRKHPLTPIITTNKVTKGRSKTGCLTCRKRKKKCDEAKPRCKVESPCGSAHHY